MSDLEHLASLAEWCCRYFIVGAEAPGINGGAEDPGITGGTGDADIIGGAGAPGLTGGAGFADISLAQLEYLVSLAELEFRASLAELVLPIFHWRSWSSGHHWRSWCCRYFTGGAGALGITGGVVVADNHWRSWSSGHHWRSCCCRKSLAELELWASLAELLLPIITGGAGALGITGGAGVADISLAELELRASLADLVLPIFHWRSCSSGHHCRSWCCRYFTGGAGVPGITGSAGVADISLAEMELRASVSELVLPIFDWRSCSSGHQWRSWCCRYLIG